MRIWHFTHETRKKNPKKISTLDGCATSHTLERGYLYIRALFASE